MKKRKMGQDLILVSPFHNVLHEPQVYRSPKCNIYSTLVFFKRMQLCLLVFNSNFFQLNLVFAVLQRCILLCTAGYILWSMDDMFF